MTSLKQSDLLHEVQEIIELGLKSGQVMPAAVITQSIVNDHDEIVGADRDFYLLCAYHHVRNSVRAVLRDYRGSAEHTPAQLKLDGYEYLQKAYLIERGLGQETEPTVVPITQCTDAELALKAREYRAMADGCNHHADELDRYRQQRFKNPN